MRCPECKKPGMVALQDPNQSETRHTRLCIYCGFRFTPLRLSPAEFREWDTRMRERARSDDKEAHICFDNLLLERDKKKWAIKRGELPDVR